MLRKSGLQLEVGVVYELLQMFYIQGVFTLVYYRILKVQKRALKTNSLLLRLTFVYNSTRNQIDYQVQKVLTEKWKIIHDITSVKYNEMFSH